MGSSASAALAALIALAAAGCAVDRTGLLVGDSGTPPVDLGEVDAFVENDANELDLGREDLGGEDLGRDLGLEDLGPPGPIVALDTGRFTRNLEAYQRDSDPIAGPFYSLVPIDTLRYETLASGGRLALIEGARTNDVRRSRMRSGTGWNAGSGAVSSDSQPGPDGTNNASRENVTIGGYSRYSLVATAAPCTSSLWQMAPTANASYHVDSYGTSSALVHWEAASGLTSTWQRAIVRQTVGTAIWFVPSDARAGALAAAAHDTISDFVQTEAGRFPSSPIVNTGTVGQTRPADTLTWAAASASLLSQRHGFRHVRPIFESSSSVVDGDVFWLMSIADGSNGVRISQTAGVITIEAVESGVVKASSQPFTTLADTDLGSVEWDPAGGLVYVNGAPGPAGTPWTWTAGPLRVGGIHGAASEAFCGLSDIW